MPLKFWWDAFSAATLVINSLSSKAINGQIPLEILTKRKVDFTSLRIFGSACFPYLRPYNTHKFDFKTNKCVYIGPSSIHKGYKCLSATGRIYITRHVQLNESDFPFKEVGGSFHSRRDPTQTAHFHSLPNQPTTSLNSFHNPLSYLTNNPSSAHNLTCQTTAHNEPNPSHSSYLNIQREFTSLGPLSPNLANQITLIFPWPPLHYLHLTLIQNFVPHIHHLTHQIHPHLHFLATILYLLL